MEPRKWKSMDLLVEFSSGFDRNRPRMETILSQLDEICKKTKQRKEKLPARIGSAVAKYGSAIGFFFLATVTGGLSLIVAGGAAVVGAAAGTAIHHKITDGETLDQVKELVTEFCDLVKPLRDIQEERKDMMGKLDKNHEDLFMRIQSLINGLFGLFINFTSDSTVKRLLEVTEQCRTILLELKRLREKELREKELKELKELREKELNKLELREKELKEKELKEELELKELREQRMKELKIRREKRIHEEYADNLYYFLSSYHSHRDHLHRIIRELKNTELNVQTMEDTERVWATETSEELKELFVLRTEAVFWKRQCSSLKRNSEELRDLETSSDKKQRWLDLEQSISDFRDKLSSLSLTQSSEEFEETLSELDKLCEQMRLKGPISCKIKFFEFRTRQQS